MAQKERKLRNRRKRASKGRAIRVSNAVYDKLNKNRRGQSWDAMFRSMLGIESREGKAQPLIEGYLETMTGMFWLKLPENTWTELEETAYKMATNIVEKKRPKVISWPVRMREMRELP